MEPSRVGSFDNEMFRELHGLEKDCPIRLDEAPELCSAGYCSYCKKMKQIANSHDITKSDMGFNCPLHYPKGLSM